MLSRPRLILNRFFLILLFLPIVNARIAIANDLQFESVFTSSEILAVAESVSGHPVARPKIVFIPGILGSKLLKPNSDELIWGGDKFDRPELFYDGTTKLTPATFDQLAINLVFKVFRHSIYGDALEKLRNRGEINEHDLLDFSYDWRQSNSKSADDLNIWLCQNKEALATNRVIFVAHSMGGLVLKHWFINYYDKDVGCNANESNWLDVRRVFFVGTPHYGAPKALTALFKGYSLYDGNWFVDKYVSEGINSYGFSFDSLYELLPVQHDEACNPLYGAASGLPTALSDTANGLEYAKIFNINFMRAFDLPYSPLGAQKTEFQETRLDAILKKAEKYACDLAQYKFPKLGLDKVIAIIGQGVTDELNNNTAAALKNADGNWVPIRANGDGTVLRPSAEWKNLIVDDRNVAYARAEHMDLLDQPEVRSKINAAVHAIAIQALPVDVAGSKKALASLDEQNKIFFPTPDDPTVARFAREMNSKLFALRKMTDEDVSQAASDARKSLSVDSALSYALNDYAATLKNAPRLGDFFAKQAAGKELLDLGYKNDALEVFSKTIEKSPKVLEQARSSNLSSELISKLERAIADSYNSRGTINLNNFKFDEARTDFDAAVKLGSTRAKSSLQVLNRLQFQ